MSVLLFLSLGCSPPPEVPILEEVGFPTAAGAPRGQDPFGRVRVTLGEGATRVQLTGGGELGLAGPEALGPWRGACAPGHEPCRGRAERVVAGGLTEWWMATPLGLEHGFTVERGGALLRVPVHLEGARATVGAGGRDAHLRTEAGAAVGYRALAAVDAEGRSLPAHFVSEGPTLWIEVDSSTATFPVEIDPLLSADWATYAWSGDELLLLPDVNGDGYDELVVGNSYAERSSSTDDTGVVYVFYGGPGGPASTPDLTWYASTAEGHAPSALAGGDLNGDGYGDLVIGAADYGTYGRIWVMYGSSSGLPATEDDTVYLTTLVDLGTDLAVADFDQDGFDDVVAGAGGTTTSVMFRGSAAGLEGTASWSTTAAATYTAHVREGDFDGDGDPDLVLALPYYTYGQAYEGMLWRYDNDGTGLATSAAWSWDSDVSGAYCGGSLASGDVNGDGADDLAVGCRYVDATYSDEGRVYAFYGGAAGFASSADWSDDGGGSSLNYGYRVAMIGDADADGDDELVAVGHYGVGEIRGYAGSPEGLADVPDVVWAGEAGDYDYWGEALAGGGDLDGDGFADAALSALDAGSASYTGDYWAGYSVVFYGDGDGLLHADDVPDGWAEPSGSVLYYGQALTAGADFNADGRDDVVAGLAGYGYTYFGTAGGMSYRTSSRFAEYYAGALDVGGDVTGDGVPDLLLGAPYHRPSSLYVGALVLFQGSSTGPASSPTSTLTGTGTGTSGTADGYAEEVAHLGDVNGDGYGDVAAGYRRYDGGVTDQGAVYVYYGSSAGLSTTGATEIDGGEDSALYGDTVRGGDLDEDGYADMVVSSPYWDGDLPDRGRVQVFYGSAGGISTTAGLEFEGEAEGELFGILMDVADGDGDGLPDLAVFLGGPGELRVYPGDGAGFATEASATIPVSGYSATQTRLRWVADMDGDGDRELAVGYAEDFGVTVYPGVPGGVDDTPMMDVNDVVYGASCGWDFVGADIDGDGLGDLLVGCPAVGDEGALAVYFGEAVDQDGDGYGTDTDCDDGDATVNPSATDRCDGIDNNCDGTADESAPTWYEDADLDGFGDPARSTEACDAPSGWVENAGDCDDADADTYPGAIEACDGADDDCDGAVDEAGATGEGTWYPDADGDGHGGLGAATTACTLPVGYAASQDDCDDADPETHPGADERCDGEDDDCDGVTDEDDAVDAPAWYRDGDGDGFGDAEDLVRACAAPAGRVADATDCDDTRADILPGGPESCDGEDDDCDGVIDEADATDADTWYADPDGDGYGDPTESAPGCAAPSGYVGDATDCDSGSSAVNPGATEACNGVDDDCDGGIDEAGASGSLTWHRDADGDRYGATASTTDACTAPDGYVADATDCDDARADVHPGAAEVCNDVDDDCDGAADDGLSTSTWYADVDADGYGDPLTGEADCAQPEDRVADGTDCDDARSDVHPGADEVWYDGVDQDCDGNDDDQDGDGEGVATDCDDEDPTRTDCDGEDSGDSGDRGDDTGGEPKATGCGCATPGEGGEAPLVALVLAALGLRRRRASPPGPQ